MDFTLYKQLRNILDWLIPGTCIKCSKPTNTLDHPCCVECYPNLPFQSNTCQHCGQRLAHSQDLCGRCLADPPAYDRCYCPFEYSGAISKQIIRFKYRQRPDLAHGLAKLLARELMDQIDSMPDLLIPVPMHRSRLRQRGYNQANLLAIKLSKLLNVPYALDVVEKHKTTPQQATLRLKQRQQNIADSFRITRKIDAESVVIIDDVVTTGSTVQEIAKILKKNGVDYIQVWGIAHTL